MTDPQRPGSTDTGGQAPAAPDLWAAAATARPAAGKPAASQTPPGWEREVLEKLRSGQNVTLLPTYFLLRGSSATSDSFPTTFESYFTIFDFLTSHLSALETTIRSSGDDVLPNIYCGVLPLLLVI